MRLNDRAEPLVYGGAVSPNDHQRAILPLGHTARSDRRFAAASADVSALCARAGGLWQKVRR
jgi:hypothetical protein